MAKNASLGSRRRGNISGEYVKVGGPLSSGGPEGDGEGLSLVTYSGGHLLVCLGHTQASHKAVGKTKRSKAFKKTRTAGAFFFAESPF